VDNEMDYNSHYHDRIRITPGHEEYHQQSIPCWAAVVTRVHALEELGCTLF
jgi:hypothetical protein